MKKVIACTLCIIFSAHGMDHHGIALDVMHTKLLQQKYPTLFPITQTNATGIIYAFYSPTEGKTRVIVGRNNGTCERGVIIEDQDLEIVNADIDQRAYKGYLQAYEGLVKQGHSKELALEKTH